MNLITPMSPLPCTAWFNFAAAPAPRRRMGANITLRHCERSEAIQSQVFDAALDRHGGKSRLAMTMRPMLARMREGGDPC
jgi:hypothetical protein